MMKINASNITNTINPGWVPCSRNAYRFIPITATPGDKRNELSNHLGNVLSVVSDKKIPKLAGSSLAYFNPDVKAYNDYFPGGMLLPGRHANTSDYRYGFQGQEMDDEIKGEGNNVNFKYRIHDPRAGRFFAVDPLTAKYPHYTPYSFSGNKVIAYGELEGLEEYEANLLNGHKVRMYNIRPGENLSVISKTTGVAVQDIKLYFNLNDHFRVFGCKF